MIILITVCFRAVILAPFGMAGTLTGQSGRAMDTATSRLLEEWRHFYPITPRENSDPSLPQAVEVSIKKNFTHLHVFYKFIYIYAIF